MRSEVLVPVLALIFLLPWGVEAAPTSGSLVRVEVSPLGSVAPASAVQTVRRATHGGTGGVAPHRGPPEGDVRTARRSAHGDTRRAGPHRGPQEASVSPAVIAETARRSARAGAGEAGPHRGSPKGSVEPDGAGPHHKPPKGSASIISGWVLVVLASEHPQPGGKPTVPAWFDQGMREALADSLGVCRPSLQILQTRIVHTDRATLPESMTERRLQHASFLHRVQQFVRRSKRASPRTLYMSRIRSVFEVRVFREMRANESEIARRIDNLQIYSRFTDLSRALDHSMQTDVEEGVILDDVGYASRHALYRPPLSRAERDACMEEETLADVRRAQPYIMFSAVVLLTLTTCVGCAVFTIKHPSIVPSRMNPLVRRGDEGS